MIMLNRLLPRRMMTVLLAARTTRAQAKQSDDLGMVAIAAAIVMALWTYRSEKAKQRREVERPGQSLTEYLDR